MSTTKEAGIGQRKVSRGTNVLSVPNKPICGFATLTPNRGVTAMRRCLITTVLLASCSSDPVAYSPKGSFSEKENADVFIQAWYSAQLEALEEHPLRNRSKSHEVYRFTWLRTFGQPMAFRVQRKDKSHKNRAAWFRWASLRHAPAAFCGDITRTPAAVHRRKFDG